MRHRGGNFFYDPRRAKSPPKEISISNFSRRSSGPKTVSRKNASQKKRSGGGKSRVILHRIQWIETRRPPGRPHRSRVEGGGGKVSSRPSFFSSDEKIIFTLPKLCEPFFLGCGGGGMMQFRKVFCATLQPLLCELQKFESAQ